MTTEYAKQLADEAHALANKLKWSLWADPSDPKVQRARLVLLRAQERLFRRAKRWHELRYD